MNDPIKSYCVCMTFNGRSHFVGPVSKEDAKELVARINKIQNSGLTSTIKLTSIEDFNIFLSIVGGE